MLSIINDGLKHKRRRVNYSGKRKTLTGLRKCGGRKSASSCVSNPNCSWVKSSRVCRPKANRRVGHKLPPVFYGPTLPADAGRKRSTKRSRRSKSKNSRSPKRSKRSKSKKSRSPKRSKRSKSKKSRSPKRSKRSRSKSCGSRRVLRKSHRRSSGKRVKSVCAKKPLKCTPRKILRRSFRNKNNKKVKAVCVRLSQRSRSKKQ